MENDSIIFIFSGILLIIAGIGYTFVKVDDTARKKDEKRFGPLTNFNMGLGYTFLRNKWMKVFVIIITMGMGIIFLLLGFKVFN